MPSALAITRSSGVVMNPRTRSALAPTYTVETRTTAMSLRGYCRTLSARIDCRPAIRMTRLTTIASTGRLTKRSVNFMTCVRLLIFGFGCGAVGRLHLVVHLDGDTIPQFEHSRGHYFLAGVQTRHDRDLISA